MRGLIAVAFLLLLPRLSFAAQVDFASIPVDSVVADQFAPELRFGAYNGNITGAVVSTTSGNAASFTRCTGSIECEFFTPGARLFFAHSHSDVMLKLVALPAQINFLIKVTLKCLDAAGNVVAVGGVWVASGNPPTSLLVHFPPQPFVSAILESDSEQVQGTFGLLSVIYDDVTSSPPDFSLDGPGSFNILAGGAAQAKVASIHRFGGSSGAVAYTVSGAPTGTSESATPASSASDQTVVSAKATSSASPGVYPLTLAAMPSSPAVGPAARTASFFVSIRPGLTVSSPDLIEASSCAASGPSKGTIDVPVSVSRAGAASAPVTISVSGLPSTVTVKIISAESGPPEVLHFPGNVVAESVILRLSIDSGVQIPLNTLIVVTASNGQFTATRTFGLGGFCPRTNWNFVVRGQFVCVNHNVTFPIEGAVVAIMRDDWFAFDPILTEVQTDTDGRFEAQIATHGVDTYYAKLFLNDHEGVYLRNWWSNDVEEINSVNRSDNAKGLIDLGTTSVSRSDGGSPRCAIWQGGRTAWREFTATTGQSPVIGDFGAYQITMESTASDIVWTSRDTTHWEIGSSTPQFSGPLPSIPDPSHVPFLTSGTPDIFAVWGTNIHEFGHALRHTADGDDNEFNLDDTRFFYGHTHDICEGSPSWVVNQNDGYAFNEGWAEYWENFPVPFLRGRCVGQGLDLSNFTKEGAVTNDLQKLSSSLDACAGIDTAALKDDAILRRRRALMFEVLKSRGARAIHSEAEFRSAFAQRFPACTVPAIGALSLSTSPLSAKTQAAEVQPDRFTARKSSARYLSEAAVAVTSALEHKNGELRTAESRAKAIGNQTPQRERAVRVTRPAFIRGQIAYLKLLQSTYLSARDARPTAAALMTPVEQGKRAYAVEEFDRQTRVIAIRMLNEAEAALKSQNIRLPRDEANVLELKTRVLRAGSQRTAASIFEIDTLFGPDQVQVVPGAPGTRP